MPDLRLENKTARILHISLGGGKNVAIPPTPGGVKVSLNDRDKEKFDENVATETVQGWIEAGDLVITERPSPPEEDDEPEDDAPEEDDEEA